MSDDKIKSAWEIALEKIEKIKVPEEELVKDKYIEEGKKIAARSIQDKKFKIEDNLTKYTGIPLSYVKEGIITVLLANITLPETEARKKENRGVLETIVRLKQNKQLVLAWCNNVDQLLTDYLQTRVQTLQSLKHEFNLRFVSTRQAVEKQTGMKVEIDVENQPEFQTQWRQILTNLNQEFNQVLSQQKQALSGIN